MFQTAAEERTVKARRMLVRVACATLTVVAAGSVEAQGNMGNTQRALRPGQAKGPTFLVPVFRSSERAAGLPVADAIRDELMNDNLITSMWVVSKKDLMANLEQSGYNGNEALSPNDLKQLADVSDDQRIGWIRPVTGA